MSKTRLSRAARRSRDRLRAPARPRHARGPALPLPLRPGRRGRGGVQDPHRGDGRRGARRAGRRARPRAAAPRCSAWRPTRRSATAACSPTHCKPDVQTCGSSISRPSTSQRRLTVTRARGDIGLGVCPRRRIGGTRSALAALASSASMARSHLTPAALRGLLDATPAAIGCFDATLRAIYANTAFTVTTGVQAGRVIEDAALAGRAAGDGRGRRRAAAGAARRAQPDAGLGDAVHARGGPDRDGPGRRRARGAGAARRGAVGAAAGGDAGGHGAGARGGVRGGRGGGGAAAARALGGDDPLRGRVRADRRALGRRGRPAAASRSARSCRSRTATGSPRSSRAPARRRGSTTTPRCAARPPR